MKKKLIVFDMDGVLVNSEPTHDAVFDALVRELSGGRLGGDSLHLAGVSTRILYQNALAAAGVAGDAAAFARRHFEEMLRRLPLDFPVPEPSVLRLLDALRSRGLRMAVASSSPRDFVEGALSLYGIQDRFETLVTSNDIVHMKPAPDSYLEALRRCGVEACEAAAVEDSRSGSLAAAAAGLFCFGYVNPDSGAQDLSAADVCIRDLTEVLDYL